MTQRTHVLTLTDEELRFAWLAAETIAECNDDPAAQSLDLKVTEAVIQAGIVTPAEAVKVPPNPTTDEEFAALPVLDLDAIQTSGQSTPSSAASPPRINDGYAR